MVFEGNLYRTYGEIFDKAVEVAKEGDKSKCQYFLDAYADHIISISNDMTVDDAMKIIKDNLVWYSHRYDDSVTNLIKDVYFGDK